MYKHEGVSARYMSKDSSPNRIKDMFLTIITGFATPTFYPKPLQIPVRAAASPREMGKN
jgi:hypothetical protein